MKIHYIVSIQDVPVTVQQFLQKITEKRFTVREIKQALEKGRCLVNREIERFGSRKLYEGDEIDLIEFTKEELKSTPFAFVRERVLFENEALLAYDKPAGIPTMDHGIFEIIKKAKGPLYAVHRLDKDTSGVLVFAKTKKAEEALIASFKERSVQKHYLAIVQGKFSKKNGSITSYLGKVGEFQGQSLIGPVDKAKGQLAETAWQVLSEQDDHTFIRLIPKTGRTHQLRCHMASLGHPLIGDVQYGWKHPKDFFPSSFFLHADILEVVDPQSKKRRRFSAELPAAFKLALKDLFGIGVV